MSAHIIRPATEADIHPITAIYGESVLNGTASFEIDPPDEGEMEQRWRAIVAKGYPFLVAEEDGQILGYAYASTYNARMAYRHTVEDSIYLAAESRGKGIGGALLRSLIDECTKRGFRQMLAIIGDSAHAASIRLHKAAGFSEVGTFADIGFKHGRWLDVVLMQRSLGPGSEFPPDA
jgi:L-amino acid N-acyltransferase YncA